MSSIPTKQIDGDVAVGRNVSAGGKATIRGSVTIGHNLKVEGWLKAPNLEGPLKGFFASAEDLREAYPVPQPGWWSLVGNALPAEIWRVNAGKWSPTGATGGEFSLCLDHLEKSVEDLEGRTATAESRLADCERDIVSNTTKCRVLDAGFSGLRATQEAHGNRMDGFEQSMEEMDAAYSERCSRLRQDVNVLRFDLGLVTPVECRDEDDLEQKLASGRYGEGQLFFIPES